MEDRYLITEFQICMLRDLSKKTRKNVTEAILKNQLVFASKNLISEDVAHLSELIRKEGEKKEEKRNWLIS